MNLCVCVYTVGSCQELKLSNRERERGDRSEIDRENERRKEKRKQNFWSKAAD